jgi:hypothetical protein
MHKIEKDLLKLTYIFGVYRSYITLLPTFIIEWNVRFQLDVSENKVVFFSSAKFTDLLKSPG